MLKTVNRIISLPFIAMIRLYQLSFSPDHGFLRRLFPYGFCRFYPTCSDYSLQAIHKYGIFKGGALGIWRIMRCNPWNPGGEDLLK